ncbi:MAG: hypothetical protein MJE12_00415 [Alphaproteobacteria bacterium]|nr:hypothetical protein [Alphaproteobacteria bacterium]
MKIRIDGEVLEMDGTKVEMEVPILKVDQFESLFLVRLDDRAFDVGDPNAERNIVALDSNGTLRWRIQKTPSAPLNADGQHAWNAFVGVDTNTGNQDRLIEAYDRTGSCWNVNPETGEISDPIFAR